MYEGGVFYRPLRVMYSVYPTGTSSLMSTRRARLEGGKSLLSRIYYLAVLVAFYQEHSLFSIALSTLSFSVCVSIRIARAFPRPLEIL